MVEDQTFVAFPSWGYTTLPLCIPHELVCCVAAGPGGYPLRVLLDTGTDPSAIDAGLARRLALRTGGSGIGHGAVSDLVPFTEVILPWLYLGDLVIRDLFASALDLSGMPFQIDVVLGYNVLRQLVFRIDYRRHQLTLAHPDVGNVPDCVAAVTLPLLFFEHFPALGGVEVDGTQIPCATIDTGSNGALSVGPGLAEQLGLRLHAPGVTRSQGTGFGGSVEVLRQHNRQMRFGPFDLSGVELDTCLGSAGDLSRIGRANIGNRLLGRFAAITLDYQRQIIGVEQA